jgi:hypothetical protein
MAAAVLTKEMLISACALPLLVVWATRRLDPTAPDRGYSRTVVLAGWAGAAFALVPVVYVFLNAPPNAYAARYAASGILAVDLIGSFWSATIPFAPLTGAIALGAVLICFLVMTLTGWALLDRFGDLPTGRLILLALGLPLLGMIAYAPWPFYSIGYALPFLFGGALLVAGAVTGAHYASRGARLLLIPFSLLVAAYSVSGALAEVRPPQALLSTIRPLLPLVRHEARTDTVLVAANAFQMERPVTSFAYRFSQLASANRVPWPPTRPVSCEEAAQRARSDSTVLVVRASGICPSLGNAYRTLTASYRLPDWQSFRFIEHRTQMEIARAGRAP